MANNMCDDALKQALAYEAAARNGKEDAAGVLRQRKADLAKREAEIEAAEEARLKAIAAVQQAAGELQAREEAWVSAREVAWHTADATLAPEHIKHHQDDIMHGAVHQLEHRWIEKTGFGIAERVVAHGTESLSERVLEKGAERAVERATQHMVEVGGERLAERATEAVLEKAGANAANHMFARTFGETLRMGEHTAIHALKALRVLVPFVGMLFVFHLAEHDIRRTKEEWNSRRECRSFFVYVFFLLAVIGDIFDILAHGFVVLAGLTHVDHHFLHEVEYFGMGSAVVACFSVMVGEILAARARRRVARKSTVHIVPVTGGA